MAKITFIGAGSYIFARKVLADTMLTPALHDCDIALYDINPKTMGHTFTLLNAVNEKQNQSRASITCYDDPVLAIRGADYIINAIQVGGYDPCTITDFEIPNKYGLRQTIGDTLGIGGIFRGLRTIPVLLDYAKIIEKEAPNAWLMNYTNPMSMLTGALLHHTGVKTVGLCHSVQVCIPHLFKGLGMPTDGVQCKIAGINHMAWLLEVTKDGADLYPEIRKRALARTEKHDDMVRYEIMKRFGYYVTESSEHNAEYMPYFIKDKYPELIDRFNIPLDEYPRRCRTYSDKLQEYLSAVEDGTFEHEASNEYAAKMINAMETDTPYKIGGNVINNGLIDNLPREACVEVPCLVDASGVTPCYVGALPTQLAALNLTNINVQLLTVEAAVKKSREHIYYAAMLDPHTGSELSMDEIRALCDDLIEAHGDWLPKYH